jgi:hypothetical protein
MRRQSRFNLVLFLAFFTVLSAVILSSCYTVLKKSSGKKYQYRPEYVYVPHYPRSDCSVCHPVGPEPPPPPDPPDIEPETESKPPPARDHLRPPGGKGIKAKSGSSQKEKK